MALQPWGYKIGFSNKVNLENNLMILYAALPTHSIKDYSHLSSQQTQELKDGTYKLTVDVKFIYSERPQNFAKSPPIICPMYCQSNNWWRFRKNLWPSHNI